MASKMCSRFCRVSALDVTIMTSGTRMTSAATSLHDHSTEVKHLSHRACLKWKLYKPGRGPGGGGGGGGGEVEG